jgi:hypothetical protein
MVGMSKALFRQLLAKYPHFWRSATFHYLKLAKESALFSYHRNKGGTYTASENKQHDLYNVQHKARELR